MSTNSDSKSVLPPAPVPRGRKRKATSDPPQEHSSNETVDENTIATAPITPKKRRVQKKSVDLPPATPTPSNVRLISKPAETFETPKPKASWAAAKAIKQRFIDLFDNGGRFPHPHPSQVAACTIERLRTAGLSQRKAEYVQGLAEKFVNGEPERSNPRMPHVFSLGDLGVQRGMAAFIGRDVAKLKNKGGKWKYMSEKEMQEISEKFAPYRSVFMWYMWRVEETDVSTLE
ncbi:hypothetical protein GL218_05693 [Daldinia childiae]|uniref:uncharacterized protein n=1 Tax=Daldinia childiae TaxID=326645 RepID=UPI0014474331|nr:uncharacterized protein GL218_05693 [Daldinia childiae]KAF3058188.1 hypothetical protein GL218_05693 [Daldinia childiae]